MKQNPVALHSLEWFATAFENESPVPPALRNMSERVCREFDIRGICDPMYIANVAAFELGVGDGKSSFTTDRVCIESAQIDMLVSRFGFAYSTCIGLKKKALRPILLEELAPAKWLVPAIATQAPAVAIRTGSGPKP